MVAERRVWVHHTVMASTLLCSTNTEAVQAASCNVLNKKCLDYHSLDQTGLAAEVEVEVRAPGIDQSAGVRCEQ